MIERLYKDYKDKATIYLVYIREAHPTDGWQAPQNLRDNILFENPKTLEQRFEVAKSFCSNLKISVPALIDGIDDQAVTQYAAWPDRIYVLDAQGKIAFKSAPGPAGFRVEQVPPVLDKLLAASPELPKTTPQPEVPKPEAAPALPPADKPADGAKEDKSDNKKPDAEK